MRREGTQRVYARATGEKQAWSRKEVHECQQRTAGRWTHGNLNERQGKAAAGTVKTRKWAEVCTNETLLKRGAVFDSSSLGSTAQPWVRSEQARGKELLRGGSTASRPVM